MAKKSSLRYPLEKVLSLNTVWDPFAKHVTNNRVLLTITVTVLHIIVPGAKVAQENVVG